MYLLHQIGPRLNSNFNTLEEIINSTGPISFDGIYTSVYDHYKALKGKDITFFISGKYVGGNNSFDVANGQPLSNFCTKEQILEMRDYLGAKLGYHGWAHLRCNAIADEFDIRCEIAKPNWFETTSLAWPYGDFNLVCKTIAQDMGYTEAWSSAQGDDSQFAKVRKLLNW